MEGAMPIRPLLLSIVLLAEPLADAAACTSFPQAPLPMVELPVQSEGGTITLRVELATTPEQQSCGLMGRKSLPKNGGMLFDMRPAGPAYFWMQNTPLPLDMLFIGPDGRVVHRVLNARPYSTNSLGTDDRVEAVLEIAGGEALRLGLGVGSKVSLPWRRP
jgi:uncharacterized protein